MFNHNCQLCPLLNCNFGSALCIFGFYFCIKVKFMACNILGIKGVHYIERFMIINFKQVVNFYSFVLCNFSSFTC